MLCMDVKVSYHFQISLNHNTAQLYTSFSFNDLIQMFNFFSRGASFFPFRYGYEVTNSQETKQRQELRTSSKLASSTPYKSWDLFCL